MDTAAYKKHVVEDHDLGTPYEDGEVIFREGDLCDALYVVQKGQVRVLSIQPSGQDIEIAVAGPGEVFGITSLFDNFPRAASAIADGQTSVLKLERAKIMKAIHSDPSLVFYILKSISARTRKLKSELAQAKAKLRE